MIKTIIDTVNTLFDLNYLKSKGPIRSAKIHDYPNMIKIIALQQTNRHS